MIVKLERTHTLSGAKVEATMSVTGMSAEDAQKIALELSLDGYVFGETGGGYEVRVISVDGKAPPHPSHTAKWDTK